MEFVLGLGVYDYMRSYAHGWAYEKNSLEYARARAEKWQKMLDFWRDWASKEEECSSALGFSKMVGAGAIFYNLMPI